MCAIEQMRDGKDRIGAGSWERRCAFDVGERRRKPLVERRGKGGWTESNGEKTVQSAEGKKNNLENEGGAVRPPRRDRTAVGREEESGGVAPRAHGRRREVAGGKGGRGGEEDEASSLRERAYGSAWPRWWSKAVAQVGSKVEEEGEEKRGEKEREGGAMTGGRWRVRLWAKKEAEGTSTRGEKDRRETRWRRKWRRRRKKGLDRASEVVRQRAGATQEGALDEKGTSRRHESCRPSGRRRAEPERAAVGEGRAATCPRRVPEARRLLRRINKTKQKRSKLPCAHLRPGAAGLERARSPHVVQKGGVAAAERAGRQRRDAKRGSIGSCTRIYREA